MIAVATQSTGGGLLIVLCCAGIAACFVAGLRERMGRK